MHYINAYSLYIHYYDNRVLEMGWRHFVDNDISFDIFWVNSSGHFLMVIIDSANRSARLG